VFLVSGAVGADRTISVHGHLSEQYTDILPGMYVQAEIVTASTEGWVVPEDAVVRFAGNNYIFLKEPEHTDAGDASFVMQEVQLGSKAKGYQQIVLPAELESKAESLQYVRSGAFTVLAKAKNLDEE
jgi:cobalt-zinc-cadmium efflux system membrane fusion protein